MQGITTTISCHEPLWVCVAPGSCLPTPHGLIFLLLGIWSTQSAADTNGEVAIDSHVDCLLTTPACLPARFR